MTEESSQSAPKPRYPISGPSSSPPNKCGAGAPARAPAAVPKHGRVNAVSPYSTSPNAFLGALCVSAVKRRSCALKSNMATLRQQIATNVLTVTRFRELMKKLRENRPNDDLNLLKKAYQFSQKHHSRQSPASSQPYLVHPLEVGNVLADMKMDAVSIAAALLHDSVEDTSVTTVEIRQEFGEQVAHIVEGVTKISKIDFSSREEAQAENLRKMMLAMVDDIRVVLIKLADRLHNMLTLEHLDPYS